MTAHGQEIDDEEPILLGSHTRYLAEMERRAKKARLLSAIGDALLESGLTPEEIRARTLRLFSEP